MEGFFMNKKTPVLISVLICIFLAAPPLASVSVAKDKEYKRGRKAELSGYNNKNIHRQWEGSDKETVTGYIETVDRANGTITMDGESFDISDAEVKSNLGQKITKNYLLPGQRVSLVYQRGQLKKVMVLTDVVHAVKLPGME
jgi:hypothetical protein